MRHAVTVTALLVLLLVPLMCLRGRSRTDGLAFITPLGNLQAIAHHRGRVMVILSAMPVRKAGHAGVAPVSMVPEVGDPLLADAERRDRLKFDLLGLRVRTGDGAVCGIWPSGQRTLVVIPPWVPCLAAAVALAAPAARRRRRPGHCPQCGYDLRASAGRCPECGAAIGNALTPAAAQR